MAGHTPGPWMVENRELGFDGGDGRPGSHGSQTHLIWSDNDHDDTNVIAHIVVDGEIDKAEADANARLITQAPELLAAAKAAVDYMQWHTEVCSEPNTCPEVEAYQQLVAAIAKIDEDEEV